jgi:hypothetical protein
MRADNGMHDHDNYFEPLRRRNAMRDKYGLDCGACEHSRSCHWISCTCVILADLDAMRPTPTTEEGTDE